jgi:hypothetical protein
MPRRQEEQGGLFHIHFLEKALLYLKRFGD